MANTLSSRVPAAILIVVALMLAMAGPVAAAPTGGGASGGTVRAQLANGVICGSVTAYTAPVLATDGSISIGGTTDPVDAAATITAQAAAALATTLPLTTCLTLTVTNPGTSTAEVTGIAIAAGGQLCGAVTATGTGAARIFTVGGAVLPATATADAALTALLNAAITANATVCVDLTVDATTGAVTAVANLDATFELCGQVVATGTGAARTYTVAGLAIPAAQLSAAEAAALDLAITNSANACVALVVVDSAVASATARADVCVTVGAVSTTSVTLDGVTIPLGTGATVAPEVRAGATLAVRVSVDATTGAVTVAAGTFPGCVSAGALPDTSVTSPVSPAPLLVALALLGLVGAAVIARRREDTVA